MKIQKYYYELKDNPLKASLMGLSILLSLLFVWQIGKLLHLSFFNLEEQQELQKQPLSHVVNEDHLALTLPLFGRYIPDSHELKESMLDVQIVGIMYSEEKKQAQVILRLANGEEQVYFLGDSLPGQAIIKSINKEGIVVLHRGVLEKISLPQMELKQEPAQQPLFPVTKKDN